MIQKRLWQSCKSIGDSIIPIKKIKNSICFYLTGSLDWCLNAKTEHLCIYLFLFCVAFKGTPIMTLESFPLYGYLDCTHIKFTIQLKKIFKGLVCCYASENIAQMNDYEWLEMCQMRTSMTCSTFYNTYRSKVTQITLCTSE